MHIFPPPFIYCYFCYVHLFLENIFLHYFFTDYFFHSLKNSAELFWVILGLILMEFLYLLRAVKPCLKKVCKDGFFCITPMLTALIFFHNKSSSPGGHFWVFFGQFCGIFFSISLEPFGFL